MSIKYFFLKRLLRGKLKKIKLIVSDVDGVLTKGEIGYSCGISGLKLFNVKDGLAAKLLQKNDIKVAFISGGDSEATKKRAKALMIDECHTNVEKKSEILNDIQKRLSISKESTLYIGDDVNDLDVLPYTNLFFAPKDCNYQVEKKADIKLISKGGDGVLREVCDMLLAIKDFKNNNEEC